MKLWTYYVTHTFINSVKKIFRSKVVLVIVAFVFVCGLLGAAGGFVASAIGSKEQSVETTETEVVGEIEETEDIEDEMTAEDTRIVKIWVEAVVMILLIFALLLGIRSGAKKGTDIFMMADVNFLFTAPMKPQSVLLFRLSLQMIVSLVASIYIIFQLPNLIINLHLSGFAIIAILFAWIIWVLLQKVMSVFSYTLINTYPSLRKCLLPFAITVLILLVFITGCVYVGCEEDITETMSHLYASKWSRMIPIIGWYKGMVMTAIEGEIGWSLLYMFLLVLSVLGIVWGVWKLKADFYEDALTGAQTRDAITNVANEQNSAVVIQGNKKRSDKIKRTSELKGWGANIFYTKTRYNRKRFSYFGFITKTMLVYLCVGVATAFFCIKVLEVSEFSIAAILVAFVLFFRNYGNPIAEESNTQWLFLVPEDPYKKVFFAMMGGSYACALDIFPVLLVVAVMTEASPLLFFLWFVTLIVIDFMFSAVGLLLEAIFPASALDLVKSVIQFILKYVILVIVAVVFAVGILIGGMEIGIVFLLFISIALATVSFWLYPCMLHNGIS